MKKETTGACSSPYAFEGRIPLKHAIPLGIQHVLAMFVGNLTPPSSAVCLRQSWTFSSSL